MSTPSHKNEKARYRTSIDYVDNFNFPLAPIKISEDNTTSSDSIGWRANFGSKGCTSSRGSIDVQGGKMKLRDYLFLVKSSGKLKAEVKKNAEKENIQSGRVVEKSIKSVSSKADLKKRKFYMENAEKFRILGEEMEKELSVEIGYLTEVHKALREKMRSYGAVTEMQMSTLYALRHLLKDKLKGVVGDMWDLLSKNSVDSQGDLKNMTDAIIQDDQTERKPRINKKYSLGNE